MVTLAQFREITEGLPGVLRSGSKRASRQKETRRRRVLK